MSSETLPIPAKLTNYSVSYIWRIRHPHRLQFNQVERFVLHRQKQHADESTASENSSCFTVKTSLRRYENQKRS